MRGSDGKRIAELSVSGGRLERLIHCISDSERIELTW